MVSRGFGVLGPSTVGNLLCGGGFAVPLSVFLTFIL